MSAEADRTFLAADTYRAWKKRVQAANESIVVFGPYLDSLLGRLLKNSALGVGAITVVTDLSPTSAALDYRAQLIGVRALLRRGIGVRSLSRLHAKVLLCDWRTVTIGSQNFTSYARGSHETTAVPADDLSESEFVATLKEWFDAAVPVDLALVERLLADLGEEVKTVQDAQARLAASYEQLWEEFCSELERQRHLEEDRRRREKAVRLEAIGVRLGAAVRAARERLARPVVWAHLSEVGDRDKYDTLLADQGSDLTRWLTHSPGQAATYQSLARLRMYPVILNPSGRMGFGRVGETRISYVRSAVNWTDPRTIAGMKYRMQVEFPDEGFENANLHIILRPLYTQSTTAITLLVRFDGIEAVLVGHEIVGDGLFSDYASGASLHMLSPDDVVASFTSPKPFRQLMQSAFSDFKYEEPLLYAPNADKFFPPGFLLVTLIEYAEQPVFVVTQQT